MKPKASFTDLMDILDNKDISEIKESLKKLTLEDINVQDEDGETVLHSKINDKELIKLLLEKGANPNIQNSRGQTALHYALDKEKANIDIVKLLLKNRANLNIKDATGSTVLHYAVDKKNIDRDLIKLLLENGANPNIQDAIDELPLNIVRKRINNDIDISHLNLENNKSLKAIIKLLKDKMKEIKNYEGSFILSEAIRILPLIGEFLTYLGDKIAPIGKTVIEGYETSIGAIPLSTATKDVAKHYLKITAPFIAIAAIVRAGWTFYNEYSEQGLKKSSMHALGEAGKTVAEGAAGVAGATAFVALATAIGASATAVAIAPVVGGFVAGLMLEKGINAVRGK